MTRIFKIRLAYSAETARKVPKAHLEGAGWQVTRRLVWKLNANSIAKRCLRWGSRRLRQRRGVPSVC
jgi:hypothetical protein